MPSANLAARTAFAGESFSRGGLRDRLIEVNRRVRTIRRVIIEPRYRGLGLATCLVRDTLGLVGSEMVESYTVMGQASGFFERAGMQVYYPPPRQEALTLQAALREVGIAEDLWLDSRGVFERLERLTGESKARLDRRIADFLKAYKNRRSMPNGPERIRFVLSRLSGRPVYYLWRNPAFHDRAISAAA